MAFAPRESCMPENSELWPRRKVCSPASFYLPGSPQRASRFCTRVLTVLEHFYSVNEDLFHSGGILSRFFKGGVIGDCRGIKHHHVGEHVRFQESAMIEFEVCGRQGAEAPNRLRQADQIFLTHALARDAPQHSVGARL